MHVVKCMLDLLMLLDGAFKVANIPAISESVRIHVHWHIFPDMPFQLVPVLEVDGSARLCGHVNVARYIGEKYSEHNYVIS